MLKCTQLSLRRGARELLHEVSFTIHSGQRVGVTGANGVGKSSLFALIRKELQPDSGDISLPPNTVIASVAQETPAVNRPALDYAMDGDQALRTLEQRILVAEQLNQGEMLAHLYTEMENIGGYSAASRAACLLHGLGFSADQEQTPVNTFSGGWRMRLNLAQALMCRSDLLLLDEPTNHLDMESIESLNLALENYPGTLIFVSHDREFVSSLATRIIELSPAGITNFNDTYEEYLRRQSIV